VNQLCFDVMATPFPAHGKIKSILRQSFWAAAHVFVQSGAWFN